LLHYTTSNLLDKLEKRHFVRRERQDADQRVVRLFLTAEGRETVSRAPKPTRGVLPDALIRLPHEELDCLKKAWGFCLR